MTAQEISRQAFEAWITAPPYEKGVERWPEEYIVSWPGQYKEMCVQLAWEAWQASRRSLES